MNEGYLSSRMTNDYCYHFVNIFINLKKKHYNINTKVELYHILTIIDKAIIFIQVGFS